MGWRKKQTEPEIECNGMTKTELEGCLNVIQQEERIAKIDARVKQWQRDQRKEICESIGDGHLWDCENGRYDRLFGNNLVRTCFGCGVRERNVFDYDKGEYKWHCLPDKN